VRILLSASGRASGPAHPQNERVMSPNFVWRPIRFTPEIERAYVEQMELRVVPLQRLACIIGIAAFAGYQLWDLLLDPQALPRTAPIRLAIIALFAAEFVITFVPSLRRPPYLLMQNIAVYTFLAVGFSLILAQLPNAPHCVYRIRGRMPPIERWRESGAPRASAPFAGFLSVGHFAAHERKFRRHFKGLFSRAYRQFESPLVRQ
jgi:hypothetical protein